MRRRMEKKEGSASSSSSSSFQVPRLPARQRPGISHLASLGRVHFFLGEHPGGASWIIEQNNTRTEPNHAREMDVRATARRERMTEAMCSALRGFGSAQRMPPRWARWALGLPSAVAAPGARGQGRDEGRADEEEEEEEDEG
eukprot:9477996-Pyramimonas_sp.AAC.1